MWASDLGSDCSSPLIRHVASHILHHPLKHQFSHLKVVAVSTSRAHALLAAHDALELCAWQRPGIQEVQGELSCCLKGR